MRRGGGGAVLGGFVEGAVEAAVKGGFELAGHLLAGICTGGSASGGSW